MMLSNNSIARTEAEAKIPTAKRVWEAKGYNPLKTLPNLPRELSFPPIDTSHTIFEFENIDNFSPVSSSRKFRDTPIYTEKGSPLLGQAYYAPWNSFRPHPEGADFPLPHIVNDYEITDTEDLECEEEIRDSVVSKSYTEQVTHTWATPAIDIKGPHRSSTMSFQCVGEASKEESLFDNEAAWLGSPMNVWNQRDSDCLPHILSQSMPSGRRMVSWMSDTECFSEDETDVLACATALSPSKAHVVEVNNTKTSELPIHIPPRSSSLRTSNPEKVVSGVHRTSWMTFGRDSQASASATEVESKTICQPPSINSFWSPPNTGRIPDLAMTSPPSSPELSKIHGAPFVAYPENEFNEPELHKTSDSLHMTISALENHMSSFPSNMLVADSRCTSSMRTYLHNQADSKSIRTPQYEVPPSPALSQDSMFLFQGPDSCDTTSTQDTISAYSPDHTQYSPSHTLTNLEPLRRIFPTTSNFMRSALYAHLLAYLFITTLSSTPNPINTRQSRFSQRHKTASISIPSKAATLLGIDESSPQTYGSFISATEPLESKLRDHIGTLISEMEGSFVVGRVNGGNLYISPIFLRSLVEVVRSCEML